MASTRLSYLAVKRQTTNILAVIPTHFLRYKEGDMLLKQEVIANDPIQNNRWKALNAVVGKINSEGTYKFDLDCNECVHWFAAAMGTLVSADISSGVDASVISHTMDVANTLPYLTVEQGKGNLTDTTNNRQNYRVVRGYGVMVDQFILRASDGLIELEVKTKAHGILERGKMLNNETAAATVLELDSIEGFVSGETVNLYDDTPQNETKAISSISTTNKTLTVTGIANSYTTANNAKAELTPLSPSFSLAARVFSFAHADFRFGATLAAAASAAEDNVENWEITFMNNLEERYGSIRNSPGVIAPKGASAKMKFMKYFDNKNDADRYLNVIRRACELTITDNVRISATDTGLVKFTVQFKFSDLRFTSEEMPTGKDDLYAYSIEAESFYDTSDAKALQIIVKNAQAGTVYTA